jgi:hypothetical protein
MPTFPQWMIGILIVAGGVWLATQWNAEAAWYLAILIVLGVLIKRDAALTALNELLSTIFGGNAQSTAPVTGGLPGIH